MSNNPEITIDEEIIIEHEEMLIIAPEESKNPDNVGASEPESSAHEITVEPEPSKPKISFGLAAQRKKKVEKTNLLAHEEEEHEIEPKRMKLTHFEDGVATGQENEGVVKKKPDYVIPMIVRNDWRIERLRKMEEDGSITEEDRARLAILIETQGDIQIEAEESITRRAVIYHQEELDNPEDADYSKIPVEQFGLAMLRGCGWKEEEGIGKTNRQAVALKVPEFRPKGLGLGAQIPKIQQKKVESEKPEDQIKPLGRGSYVKVIGDTSSTKKSKHLNKYGIVKAMDEDNSSCMVELALDRSLIRISQFILEPVSERDYKKNSKVLNAASYDRVKLQISRDDTHSPSPQIRKTSSRRDLEEYERLKKVEDNYPKESTSSSKMWAVPSLRVRFVDKRYKDGSYFKHKMIVIEAADKYNVELKDERGKMHYNIKQTWLETVIPRGLGGLIRIVDGPNKGEIGRIAEREDKKERLWVRLSSSDDLVKVSFDDACEWVGDEELE